VALQPRQQRVVSLVAVPVPSRRARASSVPRVMMAP
jgi:hypothetical protein